MFVLLRKRWRFSFVKKSIENHESDQFDEVIHTEESNPNGPPFASEWRALERVF